MKTGRYRVRKGLFGKAILQAEYDFPSFIGGHVASDIRNYRWLDVSFDELYDIRFRPEKSLEGEFMECDDCRGKAGSPILCTGCLHNRALIEKLN